MADASGTDVAGYVTEGPGLSAYALANGTAYRTYVTTARGPELAMAYYGLLDRTAREGVKKKESSSTGSDATTSTRCLSRRTGKGKPHAASPSEAGTA